MENFNCSEELCGDCWKNEHPKHKKEHAHLQKIRIVMDPKGEGEYLECNACKESQFPLFFFSDNKRPDISSQLKQKYSLQNKVIRIRTHTRLFSEVIAEHQRD